MAADALLVVVVGKDAGKAMDAPLAALLGDAAAQGDFEFKAGRCLYIHRPVGLRCARLTFAAATDSSAKAFKAAVVAGLASLKGMGVTYLAVARAGGESLDDSHAEAMVAAVGDAVYVYRHTKPSAPPVQIGRASCR